MKIPTPRQERRAASGNLRTVPEKFRGRRPRIEPRRSDKEAEREPLLKRIAKAIRARAELGFGRAERIERKAKTPEGAA